MLIISRKIGEELKIGDDIVVKIVDIDKNQVKVGIDAPKNIAILRMELIKEIAQQNKLSTSSKVNKEILETLSSMIRDKNDC